MLRATAIILAAIVLPFLAVAQPRSGSNPAVGCVHADKLACGCYVKIQELSCPSRSNAFEPHFFTGLELKDQLNLQLDGQDLEIVHTMHRGRAVKGDNAGSWQDEYASDTVRVQIRYAPGKSTCPKTKGEPCEYSDYRAQVVLQQLGKAKQSFNAKAVCGC